MVFEQTIKNITKQEKNIFILQITVIYMKQIMIVIKNNIKRTYYKLLK